MSDDVSRVPGQGQAPRFVRLISLVHPLPSAPSKPRRRRHEASVFTPEEQGRLRLALTNVRRSTTRAALARLMRCSYSALKKAELGTYGFSPALAVRLARVAHISLDAILAPGLRIVEPRPGPEGVA